jgi:hypothetical protein
MYNFSYFGNTFMPKIQKINKMFENLIEILRWLTAAGILAAILFGLVTTIFVFFRKTPAAPSSNYLFAALLLTFALTDTHQLWSYWGISGRHLRLYYLPIYYTFAFGPFLFFYVKSRLYPQFELHRSDLKHFILPIAQAALYVSLEFETTAYKKDFYLFNPLYGNFGKCIWLITFGLYLYFAYRFILHERGKKVSRKQIFITGWLKRMVKIFFIFYAIHASFVISNIFWYKIFEIDLNQKALFISLTELSFSAMLYWLSLNAFFAWRRHL